MATFAEEALSGNFYYLHCHACGRKGVKVTAQEMVDRGWGDVEVFGVQARLRCSCGVRGKTDISLHVGGGPGPHLETLGTIGRGSPRYWSDYARRHRAKS